MKTGRIVIITGSPGTGKTAAAAKTARESDFEKSVHMHTDDFYRCLSKGAVPPHLPGSEEQNLVVIEAFLEAAKRYARGGYDVIVDGVVGPWFLAPFLRAAQEGYEVHYIVLRAAKAETLRRAAGRAKLSREENLALVEAMWGQFADLCSYESHVLDTTGQTLEQTVSQVKSCLKERKNLLG